MLLKVLQVSCLVLVGTAVVAFAVWRSFSAKLWWLAPLSALAAYVALLSAQFLGSPDAWYRKAFQFLFDLTLSSELRALVTLLLVGAVTVALCIAAYRARPGKTRYYEVRVYETVDMPSKYKVGANVTLHTRTDGLTHTETVGEDGGAVFWSVPDQTTLSYQLEVLRSGSLSFTGGNDTINSLPAQLPIDVVAIPGEKWLPVIVKAAKPAASVLNRTLVPDYLRGVDERGDEILQSENAPWGVPRADLIINRLGYVLGYDLERRMPLWVAYAVFPTDERIRRPEVFVPDPAIHVDRQASTSDYRGSDYDRGHMISPADILFKGPVTVAEAYYMSTVTPQTPWLNRRLWREVEARVRKVVNSRRDPAFIIAGPLFIKPEGDPTFEFKTIGVGRIPVTTHFFRVLARLAEGGGLEVFGVIVPNAEDGNLEIEHYLASIREVEQVSGLRFFPLLQSEVAERIRNEAGRLW